jgi:hypothetical protein
MSSYIFADPGLGRARAGSDGGAMVSSRRYAHSVDNGCNRRVGKANLPEPSARTRQHIPAGAPCRRRVGASSASGHKFAGARAALPQIGHHLLWRRRRSPSRRQAPWILAAWRPWCDGTWLGRIRGGRSARHWCSRRREQAAQGDVRGRLQRRGHSHQGARAPQRLPLLVRGGRRRRTNCCPRGMPPCPGLDPEKNAALPRLGGGRKTGQRVS